MDQRVRRPRASSHHGHEIANGGAIRAHGSGERQGAYAENDNLEQKPETAVSPGNRGGRLPRNHLET